MTHLTMGKAYRTAPVSKKCKKIPPETFEKALAEVRGGSSIRRVAGNHYIPKSVCHRYVKHFRLHPNTPPLKKGGQCQLPPYAEEEILKNLTLCAEWGYPMTTYDLRLIVKLSLDRKGIKSKIFKDNMPGKDFAFTFLKRHKIEISERMCQNIKRNRAAINAESVNDHFDHLETSLAGVPSQKILNYNETNLGDDPGRKIVITKRGSKYPERVINSSKSATSIMFAATADGTILRPYVVYKAVFLYDKWTKGGPPRPHHPRYNHSKSGWFDALIFRDWLLKVAIPHLERLQGKKVLIGDNLSSHLSIEALKLCKQHNIQFVFLPANSTDKTQPLDIAFFGPFKRHWRAILDDWKARARLRATAIPKPQFPGLLKKLMEKVLVNGSDNIKAGFEKAGIHPLDRQKVLDHLQNKAPDPADVNQSVLNILREMRHDTNAPPKKRNKRLAVQPGKSVSAVDLESASEEDVDGNFDENAENGSSASSENEDRESSSDSESSNEESESDEEHEDDNGDVEVTFNKKRLAGVYRVKEIKEDDWVLVNLSDQPSTGCLKQTLFIGMVIDASGDDLEVNFVKYEPTKINNGKIFVWPSREDYSEVSRSLVIGQVKPPILPRRSKMMFSVNVND
ncbi:uncharacterized protein [Bemisia tabaci]|uniref:uncharacterized protein n=1 Tax=Bemisia tabaci TaxID=7038 RepID=UPI003B283192